MDTMQERHLTLCMSQHGRLGADSKLALLDPALMRCALLLMRAPHACSSCVLLMRACCVSLAGDRGSPPAVQLASPWIALKG